MKPKRPTEADLLAVIQNGFNEQLPKDRQALAPASGVAPKPKMDAAPTVSPGFVPMVRITLAVPEDLRYRLKLALLSHRRASRDKMTQDEYCAKAISAQLDQDERGEAALDEIAPWSAFLQECVREGALAAAWLPRAQALLEGIVDSDQPTVSSLA